jgi:hypothetical protein
MFKFLSEQRQREILNLCEAELLRTQKANAQFVNGPRDLSARAELLKRARALGGQGKTGHLSTLQNRPFPVSGIEAD